MGSYTLFVVPDGRALLTTPDTLDDAQRARLVVDMDRWIRGEWPTPLAIIEDVEVIRVESIDVDVPAIKPLAVAGA